MYLKETLDRNSVQMLKVERIKQQDIQETYTNIKKNKMVLQKFRLLSRL